MKESDDAIRDFWSWLQAHGAELTALVKPEEPFWDVVLRELRGVDERLGFELSEPDGDTREFVLTAQGEKDLFPLVDELVAKAPRMDGWTFVALKPPMGFDFATVYEGVRFRPLEMWFLPLENASLPHVVGLRIGIPDLQPDAKRRATAAVEMILRTGLGERSAATDIGPVLVASLPRNPKSEGYIELADLPAYIKWRKGRKPTVH